MNTLPMISHLLSLLMSANPMQYPSQSPAPHMIHTSLGQMAVYVQEVPGTIPVVFLHGVYYDHQLWDQQVSRITDRTIITLDMPMHGRSNAVDVGWTIDDCADMLLEVLDSLDVPQTIAIGHSWGSMTILRAAIREPGRFLSIGLCNMPTQGGTTGTRLRFGLQHLLTPFRTFYSRQVGKALYAAESVQKSPDIQAYLTASMLGLSGKAIRHTDRAVISRVKGSGHLPDQLRVPAIALKGQYDYVPAPGSLDLTIVPGGHVSPLEAPDEVSHFIRRVMELAE